MSKLVLLLIGILVNSVISYIVFRRLKIGSDVPYWKMCSYGFCWGLYGMFVEYVLYVMK